MNQRPLTVIFTGCWLGEMFYGQGWSFGLLCLLFAGAAFILYLKKQDAFCHFFVLFAAAVIGFSSFWLFRVEVKKTEALCQNASGSGEISGIVTWNQSTSSGSYFLLKNVTYHRQYDISGEIIVYLKESSELSPGDRVSFSGQLSTFDPPSNEGEMDLSKYYKSRGIMLRSFVSKASSISREPMQGWTPKAVLWTLRTSIQNHLEQTYGKTVSSVLKSMILGDKTSLTSEIKNDFSLSGMIHILAISGLHVSVVGGIVYRMLRKLSLPFYPAAFAGSFCVLCYFFISGSSVSSARAMIMLFVYLLAQGLGKTYDLLSSLSLSGMILLMQVPERCYDMGFLLSVICTGIIGIYLEHQNTVFPKKSTIVTKIKDHLFFCVYLQIMLVPFQIFFQYEISLLAFAANFFLLPIVSLAYPLALAEALVPIPGLSVAVETLFQMIIKGTSFYQMIPWQRITVGAVTPFWILCYFLAGYFLYRIIHLKKQMLLSSVLVFGTLIFLCGSIWFRPSGITFLDVGQGDGAVIHWKGHGVLIDGGSSSKKNVGQYVMVPYLKSIGVSKVDCAFISHSDQDHYSGILELAKMGKVSKIFFPDKKMDVSDQSLISDLKAADVDIEFLSSGEKITVCGRNLSMQCLFPDQGSDLEKNAGSMVLKARFQDISVLFTGDLEKEGEEEFLKMHPGKTQILKVAHHGSKYSTSDDFLNQIQPKLAVISDGKNNRYGHPHQELLERLSKKNITTLRTDRQGMISLRRFRGKIMAFHFLE